MAKSLRAKIKRRFRTLKRGHLSKIMFHPQNQEIYTRCEKALAGIEYRQKQLPNGFLHPDNPEAIFPQYTPAPIIDLRSTAIPNSGRQFSGGNRKVAKEPEHVDEARERRRRMKAKQERMNDEQQLEEKQPVQSMMMDVENKAVPKKKKRTSKIRKTFVF